MAPEPLGRPPLPDLEKRRKVEVWLLPHQIDVIERVALEADVQRGVLLRSIVGDFCKANT